MVLGKPYVFFLLLFLLGISFCAPLYSQWEKGTIGNGSRGSIAVDSAGNVHACYVNGPYYSDVVYAFLEDDNWTNTTLTTSGEINAVNLALDTSNFPHIIYAEANPSDFNFFLKYTHDTDTGWTLPETIVTTETDMMTWSPTVQIDKDNHIHITYLYTGADAGSGVIHYLTNSSGDWETTELNDKYQNPASNDVSMVVDTAGHVHIVSYFFNMGGPMYLTNAPDGAWSLPQLIQSNWLGGQLELLVIDISLDPDNKPHVSYVGDDDGENVENHRYATKSGPGNLWTSQQIDEGSWTSTGNAIACDPDGVEHIAYYHVESEQLRYSMNYSGSWPRDTIDIPGETSNNFMKRVEMVTDPDGFVHIVYEGNDKVLYATNRIEIPAPNIILSPDSLAFGTIDTGQVSTKTLYIKNEGVLDLHISDLQLTGGDSAEFLFEHLCDTIIPDDSCAVQITLEPDYIGEKQTTLEISSDDPDTPVITATLTGRTPYPAIGIDPTSLNFDAMEVGEADTLNISIENTGDAELTIDSLRYSGDGESVFSHRSFCWTIDQANSCEMEVIFTPGSVGTHNAVLHIYSNDPYNPEVIVTLEGRTPAARIEAETELLNFGLVPVGNLATATLDIHNTGERPLNLSSITITGTDATLFQSSNTCGMISSGGSCTLDLTFVPKSEGPKSALLRISSNDPDYPEYGVILQGTGGEIVNMAFTYDSGDDDRFFCMDTLSSGGFIVGGRNGTNAYLANISPEGTILWQREYISGIYSTSVILTVRELWDHSIVVGGSTFGRYRWIARLDSQGEIIWQKRAEDDYGGFIHDIKITSDSCLIAVGETWPRGPADADMWIGKFDSTGTVLWQKIVGKEMEGNLNPNFERGTNVLEDDYGNFIVTDGGSVSSPESSVIKHPDGGYLYGGQTPRLWKFSQTGDVLWQKETRDARGYDFWLTHISPGDAILWQKSYPEPGESYLEYIYDLSLTPSGNIIAVGSSHYSNEYKMRVMCITKSGDIVWQKKFIFPETQQGYKVLVKSNGSIAIAGYMETEPLNKDGWMVHLDASGKLDGCASGYLVNTSASAEPDNSVLEDINLPYQISSVAFIDTDFTDTVASATINDLCSGIPADVDYDGIDDAEEQGPDGMDEEYDGNADGLPDYQQNQVASCHTWDGAHYVTLEVSGDLFLQDVEPIDNPDPEGSPEDMEFPLGFFSFKVYGLDSGGTAVLTIHIPEGLDLETYYKYAPTHDQMVSHWYEFLYNDTTGAVIDTDKIMLYLKDNDRGDADLLENGIVEEPGAAGYRVIVLSPPVLSEPGHKDTDIPLEQVFRWDTIENASYYQLILAKDSAFMEISYEADSILNDSLKISGLANQTEYYWHVRACAPEDTSDWSDTWHFITLDTTSAEEIVLSTPVLIEPAHGAVDVSLEHVFRWDTVEHAAFYQFELATESIFVAPVHQADSVASDSLYVSGLKSFTEYFWHVRALAEEDTSEWSETRHFTTMDTTNKEIILSIPVLIEPVNSAIDIPLEQVFRWDTIEHAAFYQFRLASDSVFTEPVHLVDSITSDTLAVSGLSSLTEYFWHVRAFTESDTSEWSTTWHFTTIDTTTTQEFILSIPMLIEPANGIVDVPLEQVFRWDTVENAMFYQFQLASDSVFAAMVHQADSVTQESMAVSGLNNLTRYFWHARALAEEDTSEWSDTWSFTTIDTISVSGISAINEIPRVRTVLRDIFPNPFYAFTNITVDVNGASDRVLLEVYNLHGKKIETIMNRNLYHGSHTIFWQHDGLSPGIYLIVMRAGINCDIQKCIIR